MNPDFPEQLQNYFTNVATLPELLNHIDKLLYCLVYYYSVEGANDFSIIYDDMYRFKQVLQNYNTPNDNGNTGDKEQA